MCSKNSIPCLGDASACIGPLGFILGDTFSPEDRGMLLELYDLINEHIFDYQDEPVWESKIMGGVRSSVFPLLSPGSSLDLLSEAIIRDIKALVYPEAPSNIAGAKRFALK